MTRKSKPPKAKKSRKKAQTPAAGAPATRDSEPEVTRDSDPAVTSEPARDSDPAVARESDATRDSERALESEPARDPGETAPARDSDPAVRESEPARDSDPVTRESAPTLTPVVSLDSAPTIAAIPIENTQPVETAAIVATTTETESKMMSVASDPDLSMGVASPDTTKSDEPARPVPPPPPKPSDENRGPSPISAPATQPDENRDPSLISAPATLSTPASSIVRDVSAAGDKSEEPMVDLREGSRRGGDDRRRETREANASTKPEATKLEATKSDASKSDASKSDDSKSDDSKSDDSRSDATKPTPIVELRPVPERVDAATGEIVERRSGDNDRRKEPAPRRKDDEGIASAPATATAAPEPTPVAYSDPEAATLPAPEPIAQTVAPVQALDPGAAALEAARIAGEIVGDISTASGAAIVAAAAAGAAIEAARQQQAAGVSTVAPQAAGAAAAAAVAAATTAANAEAPPATEGATGDPVTTVRMQRERILRALAEEVAVNPNLGEVKDPLTASQANAPLARAGGQAQQPLEARAPIEGEATEEEVLDAVQIAAVAIQKLRQRASTDIANIRGHYHRHDLVVLLAALIIIVVAGRLHTGLVTPPNVRFPEHEQDQEALARGLTFEHSAAWLKAEKLPPWPPRIARDPTGQPPRNTGAYYSALTSSVDPNARIEIFIDKRPAWTNIVTGLELDRRQRWGELYTLDSSTVEEIGDQNWLRTAYRYAHAPEKGDVPRVDRAVEYATVDREQIYVVTMFGREQELARIESVVAPSLRVPQKPGTRSALPLVPQTRGATHRSYPDPVAKAFDSTVMIVVADMIDGKLQARGGGSGVIVGADGSILTNYHVIHDKNGRLHDVFVIGRFGQLDQAPQLQCAGRPNRSKLQRELDLALVKCDTDLDGRTWTPSSVGIWQTLAPAKTQDIIGQRLWVLGFPDVGGGGLTLSTGEITGWTGQDGSAGRDFIKTDASITHGNSGGPAVDDKGRLVGIATASRTKLSQNGGVIETKQVGLVRPLAAASDLIAIATIGWTPREGHTDVEIQPSAVEASPEGIRIATHVFDHSSDAPVRDALVMVLKGGIREGEIDINRLDDQVIAWGRSNTQGEVALKQPVPFGTYTVLVRASGYQPLIGENALVLDDDSPAAFDPWGGIRLRPL